MMTVLAIIIGALCVYSFESFRQALLVALALALSLYAVCGNLGLV